MPHLLTLRKGVVWVEAKHELPQFAHLQLEGFGGFKVFPVDGLRLSRLENIQIAPDQLESVSNFLQLDGRVKVLLHHCLLLQILQSVQLVAQLLVKFCLVDALDLEVPWSEHGIVSLVHVAGHLDVARAVWEARPLPILHLQVLISLQGFDFIVAKGPPQELQLHQADLVEQVVAVIVRLVQHQFEVLARHTQVHCLQFSGLVAALLVAVKTEVAEAAEDEARVCRGDELADSVVWLHVGWGVDTGHERVQLDFLGDFGLVSQQLNLSEVDAALKTNDDFLRVDAETLAVPSNKVVWVSGAGSQFSHRVTRIHT